MTTFHVKHNFSAMLSILEKGIPLAFEQAQSELSLHIKVKLLP
jgi:hypothetical protein